MRSSPRRSTKRPGMALLLALGILALAGLLAATLLTALAAARQSQRVGHERAQAQWLVEAGLQRAAARRALDAGYRGETWHIDAEALAEVLPANRGADVVLEIASDESSGRLAVTAQVQLRADRHRVVRTAKTVALSLSD